MAPWRFAAVLSILMISIISEGKKSVEYVSIDKLRPGQSTVSFQEVERKLNKDGRELKYEKGKAWVGFEDAAPAILLPGNVYLVADKHHHITASLNAGAKLYPIKIIADYSKLELKEAYEKALREKRVYLEPEEKLSKLMDLSFGALTDNPWRYTAVVIRAKLKVDRRKNGKIESVRASGSNTPIWAKVDDEAKPFVELGLSTLLRVNKVPAYTEVSDAQNEQIRGLFVKLKDQNEKLMDGVLLIREKQEAKNINWGKFLEAVEPFCAPLLQAD